MNLKDFTIHFADWSDYLIILVTVLSLLSFRCNSYFKLLSSYLLVLSALTLATILTANYGINNSYVYHTIGCIDLIFIFLLYRKLGLKNGWNWGFLIVLTAYLTDSCFAVITSTEVINSIGQSLSMLFIMTLGFNFLWKIYREEKITQLKNYPYFYINTGFTLYSSGAFFGYLLIARFSSNEQPDENFYYSWLLVSGFIYIKFILISIGIIIHKINAK